MDHEEIKKLQDDYKQLQDAYKKLKETNDSNLSKITEYEQNIETLRNDKKLAEDRYTDLFKQTILVPNNNQQKQEVKTPKETDVMKIEDLYII